MAYTSTITIKYKGSTLFGIPYNPATYTTEWTPPAYTSQIVVTVAGGGGGGGGYHKSCGSAGLNGHYGGDGGAGYLKTYSFTITPSARPPTYKCTIGSGGYPGESGNPGDGSSGYSTSFAVVGGSTLVSASGGGGGGGGFGATLPKGVGANGIGGTGPAGGLGGKQRDTDPNGHPGSGGYITIQYTVQDPPPPPPPPSPSYSVSPDVSTVNEGALITWTVRTSNYGSGTLYYTIEGTVSAADFTDNSLQGSVIVSSNTGTIVKMLTTDALTEGPETAILRLRTNSTSGTIVATSSTVTVVDTSQTSNPLAPTYQLARTSSSINEGASVSFTLYTTGVDSETLVPYTVTGINAGDLVSGNLTGNFIVGSVNTVTFVTRTDLITEGTETLTITLTGKGISSSCIIADTSITPSESYTLTRSASSVNEGEFVSFTLTTVGVPNGTVVGYQITGITPLDINNTVLTGNFVVNNNIAVAGFNVSSDMLDEGTETLVITLVNGRASSSVDIIDSSAPERRILVKDEDQWREPRRIYVKHNNEWKPIRRVYTKISNQWRLVFDNDVWSTMLSSVATGSLTTPWNAEVYGTLTVTFASSADANYFFNTGGKIRFYSSRTGGSNTLQNNAWTSLLNSIGTREFGGFWKDGFNFYSLTNSYQTVFSQIASVPYATNYFKVEALCNVANNKIATASQITFKFTWRDDYIPSGLYVYGPESGVDGTLSLWVDEYKAVAPSLEPQVISPSYVLSLLTPVSVVTPVPPLPPPVIPPPPGITYSISPATSSTIDEGISFTWTVNTANFGSGTLYYTNSGTTNANDFTDGTNSGSITILNNTGKLTKTVSPDLTTEGTETIIIQLRTGSTSGPIVSTSGTVTVNDTSLTPVIPPTYSVSPNKNLVSELDDLVTFNVITTGLTTGTVLYYTISGVSGNDFTDGTLSGAVAIVNNTASINKTIKADLTTEGQESFTLSLRTGSIGGTIVATSSSVTITDTSTTPPPPPPPPPPTYSITPSVSTVNEDGVSIRWTISTSNFGNGILYYSLTGRNITGADFADLFGFPISTRGSVSIVDNSGSFVTRVANDLATEGIETVTAELRTGSTSGPVVATSSPVTINDTSKTPTGEFTSTVNSSWKVPPGVRLVFIAASGGGGGGGGSDGGDSNHNIFGLAGKASNLTPDVEGQLVTVYTDDVISWTVGPGGAGGGVAANGATGGTTTVKLNGTTILTVAGGAGGLGRQVKTRQYGEVSINGGSNGGNGSATGYGSKGSPGQGGKVKIKY